MEKTGISAIVPGRFFDIRFIQASCAGHKCFIRSNRMVQSKEVYTGMYEMHKEFVRI